MGKDDKGDLRGVSTGYVMLGGRRWKVVGWGQGNGHAGEEEE